MPTGARGSPIFPILRTEMIHQRRRNIKCLRSLWKSKMGYLTCDFEGKSNLSLSRQSRDMGSGGFFFTQSVYIYRNSGEIKRILNGMDMASLLGGLGGNSPWFITDEMQSKSI